MATLEKNGNIVMGSPVKMRKTEVKRSKRKPTQREQVDRLLNTLPPNPMRRALVERRREFVHDTCMELASVALHAPSRVWWEDALDQMWQEATENGAGLGRGITSPQEVVIGGGLHAAIYCAVRVAMGKARPLVIEKSPRAGGAFAVSKTNSFYLNSRNRPGDLGLPGDPIKALNVIPKGPIQPSDISGDEYQGNADMAFAIRASLAMNANVIVNSEVMRIDKIGKMGTEDVYCLKLRDGREVQTGRVISARGLGDPKFFGSIRDSKRVVTFPEFMAMMDKPFPFRGVKTAAVIGMPTTRGGDSARTAVESLLGQGPTTSMSVASLDFIERIDWWGLDNAEIYGTLPDGTVAEATRARWEQCNRGRYKAIGRALPEEKGQLSRLRARPRANTVTGGFEGGYVNSIPYDLVVNCAGYARMPLNIPPWEPQETNVEDRMVARGFYKEELYIIGVESSIPITPEEQQASDALSRIPANSTSIFRYGSRTAALAASLS